MQKLLALILCIWLVGCGTLGQIEPFTDVNSQAEIIDLPTLNEVKTAELGSSIIQKSRLYKYPVLQLQNELSNGNGWTTYRLVALPGKYLVKKENEEYLYYYPEGGLQRAQWTFTSGLRISKKNADDVAMFYSFFNNDQLIIKTPLQKAIYQVKVIVKDTQDSFQQELIYNGKQGNYVKFLYRELINNLMRAPFTQDVQYDLNESKIIGFKGARIEIIEATNTNLKYKVLKSFPDI